MGSRDDERTAVHTRNAADSAASGGAVAAYPDRSELYRNYPDLEEADVRQALEFAAANIADEVAAVSEI